MLFYGVRDLRGLLTKFGVDWGMVWKTALLLAVLGVVFVEVGFALPSEMRDALYGKEGSVVEWVSMALWVVLAFMLPLIVRRMSWGIAGAMIVLLACAAREADLHKLLTGYSVLKPKFYLSGEFPLHQRVMAVLIVGAVIAGLVVAIGAIRRHAEGDGWLRARWVRLVALALVIGAASKVFDRAPASLKDFGVSISATAQSVSKAVEENFEMVLPLVLLGGAVAFRRSHRAAGE